MGRRVFFYLSRLFVKSLLAVNLFFFVFVFWIEFFEFQRRQSSLAPFSFWQSLGFLSLKIPFVLQQLFPFLIFFTALSLFWRLNKGNEILILRNFGLSVWSLTVPFLAMAGLFGTLNLFVIQPASLFLLQAHKKQERAHGNPFVLDGTTAPKIEGEALWHKQKVPGYHLIYRLQYAHGSADAMDGVSVFVFDDAYGFRTGYKAERGKVREGRLLLENVWKLSAGAGPTYHRSLPFPFKLTAQEFFQKAPAPTEVAFWELSWWIECMEKLGMSAYRYRLEQQRLLSMTFWFMGMVLLASAFGASVQRKGGAVWLLSLGLAGSLLLYFIRDVTYALAGARYLPMLFAVWSVCLLTFLVALVLLFFREEKVGT
jgi:lipopolysaccharide export system permease protein